MKKMNVWSDISSLSFVVVVLVVFFLFIVVQYPKISRFFLKEENFSLLGLFYIYLTSLHFVSMFIWRNVIRFYQEMRLEQKYCNRCEINFHIFPETNPFVHSMFFLIGSSQILQKQFVFLMMMMMMTIIIVSVLWDPKINFWIRFFYCFSWF